MFWDSRIDSEFRKVWQILNRFCCKVKSCLGISSQGNPDLVLNQQGNWVETQSYKVYTALLTQSGEDNEFFISIGDLTIGVTYLIVNNDTNPDWTNVGAPNNNIGTYFVATGTTPNSWGEGGLEYDPGAPVVTVLENTIGNIWFTYGGNGIYLAQSDNLYIDSKSFVIIGNPTWDGGIGFIQSGFDGTSTCIISTSQNFVDGPSDCALLINTPIEIRVYY